MKHTITFYTDGCAEDYEEVANIKIDDIMRSIEKDFVISYGRHHDTFGIVTVRGRVKKKKEEDQ